MARREVRCLGTAALIAAALSAALIWARLPSAEAITDPSSWGVKAQQDGGAGAPGGRAGLGGASPPPGARGRPGGASPPGARARPDGAPPPPGARGRPDDGSLPGARVDLGSASLGAGARPGGTSPPPTARRPDGASPPLSARARPGGGSPPGARIRMYGARVRPGGPSTAALRAWPEVASTAPGAYARSAGSSADGGAPVSGISPNPCPCKDGNTSRPSGKPKSAPEHPQTTAGAAPPPPPPTPPPPPPTPQEDKPAEKRIISRAMLALGCLYSLLSFCTPIITFWSTARSAEATYAFHGWFDLLASALGSFGWLLFSISQLHGEDGQIIGIAAVVVNAFGFAFYATYIVKLAVAGYMGTRACLGVMLVFLGAYISTIMVSVYGPMKRESSAAKIVSIVAFVVQIISQGIPLLTVCPLLWSMIFPPQNEPRPENINTRKLTVYSRVGSFGLSLFWVSYCSMTYEHDYFQLANDVGAVLSFVSMVLHLMYTLRPHAVDYPPAAVDV